MSTPEERIAKALDLANRYGGPDGNHHKMWVIDQMVRALTDVPIERFVGEDADGHKYEYAAQSTNDEYAAWVRNHCLGDEGPQTYSWDVGIPP